MKEKIYIVTEETNADGEIFFNCTPCKTFEVAKAAMKEIIDDINADSHFEGFKEDIQHFVLNQDKVSFSIIDPYDSYWEEINITERTIRE